MLWTNEDKRCNSLGSALDNNCCFSHSLSWKWKGGDSSWQVIKGKTKCWSTPKRWSSTSPPSAPLARGRRIVGEPQKFYLKVFFGTPCRKKKLKNRGRVKICRRTLDFRKHLKTPLGEKAYKCNQCDFASFRADNLRRQLKKKNVWMQPFATLHLFRQAIWVNIWKLPQVKNCSNAINATMHLYRQAIWGHIWKLTLEKKRTNATNATLHLYRQTTWGHIWKVTWEKHTNAINATLHLFGQTIWGDIWKSIQMQPMRLCICTGRQFEDTFENSLWRKAYKCNQCDFASVQADNLRRQLKKTYKCNHL